jgi:hypothetical protein
MKYFLILTILIISITGSYAQKNDIQIYECIFNPSIRFGKQRMKLSVNEVKIIRKFGHSIKHYSDSTSREIQIILCIFGDEKSTRGIIRAKTISDLLVKYEGIERNQILIFETPTEDCFEGNESISLGIDYKR